MKTRPHQIEDARQEHLGKTPGRLKSGLLNALRGGLKGLATGGGLGAGLGGAVAGAGLGAINPRVAQDMDFNERVKPKILERFAYEDADRMAQIAAAKAAGDQAMTQAQLANIQSTIQSRASGDEMARAKDEREARRPMIVSPGQVGYDPRTREKTFEVPATPKPPTEADVEQRFYEETGDTIESLSRKSLAGRIEAIKGRLTPDEQRLAFGGPTDADDPQAIARAQSKWAKIQDDELNSIRRDTAARVRAQYRSPQTPQPVAQDRRGTPQRKGQPGRRAISVAEAAELLK